MLIQCGKLDISDINLSLNPKSTLRTQLFQSSTSRSHSLEYKQQTVKSQMAAVKCFVGQCCNSTPKYRLGAALNIALCVCGLDPWMVVLAKQYQ